MGPETFVIACGHYYRRDASGGVVMDYGCFIAPFVDTGNLPEADLPDIGIPGLGSGDVPEVGDLGGVTDVPEGGIVIGPDAPPEYWPEPQVNDAHMTKVRDATFEDLEENPCFAGCDDCPPTIVGYPKLTSYGRNDANWIAEGQWKGYHYHAMICGLPYFPAQSNIVEWFFTSYSWDGFEPASCSMIETKYGYDGLLDYEFTSGSGSSANPGGGDIDIGTRVFPREGEGWRVDSSFRGLLNQARQQLSRLRPCPDVGLIWVFSSQLTKLYFWDVGGSDLPILQFHVPAPPEGF